MSGDDPNGPSTRSKRALRKERLHAEISPGHLWPEYDGPEEIWIPGYVIFSEDRETATTQQ